MDVHEELVQALRTALAYIDREPYAVTKQETTKAIWAALKLAQERREALALLPDAPGEKMQ